MIKPSTLKLLFLAVVTGLLFWLAWPARGFAPLLFIAWIPLLMIENHFFENQKESKRKFFWITYFAFFLFNILTTWWIYYASEFGAVCAIGFNTLFMTWVLRLFHWIHVRFKHNISYIALPVLWISFEYLHLNWDLSWPWLTMGNGFAAYPKMIQWYEYTGVFGGTVWIFAANIFAFLFYKNYSNESIHYKTDIFKNRLLRNFLLIVFLPIIISFAIYYAYTEKINPVHIAVLQPNIDPYHDKFGGMSVDAQINQLLDLADSVVDSSTDYVVAPETSIPFGFYEQEVHYNRHINQLKSYVNQHPDLAMILGASTYRFYPGGEGRSLTAHRYNEKGNDYVDDYNSALQIDHSDSIPFYHKSKLVPGPESLPFPAVTRHLQDLVFNLGGTMGSLGTQKERSVFRKNVSEKRDSSNNATAIGPIICYESIYGEFVGGYVLNGANLLFIITNDGWWHDTPGYRQHFQYARLRAIEMRRSIARSANTGTSAFINQRGDVLHETNWWVKAAIKETLNANNEITFYTKHGDYIAVICLYASLLILILTFLKGRVKRGR